MVLYFQREGKGIIMELDLVRKELNCYDDIIKNMISLRMAIIPIVADIKIKNDMPLFQGDRENEIYKNIEDFSEKSGVDGELVKNIYQLIMANALTMQEEMTKNLKGLETNKDIDSEKVRHLKRKFKKLDRIIEKDIPKIMLDIREDCERENLNLTQIATWYYYDKLE